MKTVFVFEICAVFSGIVSVWFAKKENILVYPVGIFSVLIWVYLCWLGDLYGQAMVNIFFFVMNVYGWYNWLRKEEDDSIAVAVSFNTKKQNSLCLLATTLLWMMLCSILLPFKSIEEIQFYVILEALITAMNFVAMFLLAWKRIENWIYWIIADIMCIPLFVHKDYYLGVVQFGIFIVIAYYGYQNWKKQIVVHQ